MNVHELKALFQKNGAIKNQAPSGSIYSNTIKPSNMNNKTINHPIPQQHQIPKINPHSVSISQAQVCQQEPQKIGIKNNDFLSELNKKLQNKTIKPKYLEEQSNTQEVIVESAKVKQQERSIKPPIQKKVQEVQVKKEKIDVNQYIQVQRQSKKQEIVIKQQPKAPVVIEKQAQLNFDEIIFGNLQRSRIKQPSRKARYGIDERYPTNKQQEILFQEWEQSRTTIQQANKNAAKQNVQNISYLRPSQAPKSKQFKSNVVYSKLPSNDKIKRIQKIVNFIFSKSSNQYISNGKTQNIINQNMIKLASQQVPVMLCYSPPAVPLSQPIKIQQPIIPIQIKEQQPIVSANQPTKQQASSQNQNIQQEQPRSMFAMSKQMLNQINSQIKRRNDIIQNTVPRQEGRSKSPISRKKKHFQKFDDS